MRGRSNFEHLQKDATVAMAIMAYLCVSVLL